MFSQFLARQNGGTYVSRHPASTKSAAEPVQAHKISRKSPIIGVLGAKGGVGATTIALNLTAALSADSNGAMLIDANLQQPDAAVMLGLESKYGLLDLLERRADVDANIVNACSMRFSASLSCRMITPPTTGAATAPLHASDIANCLPSWRDAADAWVVDLPRYLDKHLVMLMDRCDVVCLVVEPTITALNAAKRWQQIFTELEYPDEKIVVVVNRWGGKVKLVEKQLQNLPQFADCAKVPNAYELTELACTRGEPAIAIDARAPYSVAIKKLAKELLENNHG